MLDFRKLLVARSNSLAFLLSTYLAAFAWVSADNLAEKTNGNSPSSDLVTQPAANQENKAANAGSDRLQGSVRDSALSPSSKFEPGAQFNRRGNSAVEDQSDQVYTAGLNSAEMRSLSDHDVVLVIDKSGSMDLEDCPPPGVDGLSPQAFSFVLSSGEISRWNWCAAEATRLARVTSANSGLTVVIFSGYFRTFSHVPWSEIPDIFRKNHPGGNTNLAPALTSVFGEYFERKKAANSKVKPLAVGVVTDGCPDSESTVRNSIIDATHAMLNAKDLTITFFLIGGEDKHGEDFIADLDNNLVKKGATYDVVRAVPFSTLTRVGLAKALADTLQ